MITLRLPVIGSGRRTVRRSGLLRSFDEAMTAAWLPVVDDDVAAS